MVIRCLAPTTTAGEERTTSSWPRSSFWTSSTSAVRAATALLTRRAVSLSSPCWAPGEAAAAWGSAGKSGRRRRSASTYISRSGTSKINDVGIGDFRGKWIDIDFAPRLAGDEGVPLGGPAGLQDLPGGERPAGLSVLAEAHRGKPGEPSHEKQSSDAGRPGAAPGKGGQEPPAGAAASPAEPAGALRHRRRIARGTDLLADRRPQTAPR